MNALDRYGELSAWLAATDIASLELRGPDVVLRLRREGGRVEVDAGERAAAGDAPVDDGSRAPIGSRAVGSRAVAASQATVVRSPGVGLLRHRHPLHAVPLAAEGERVVAGQPLALLEVGHTLTAVVAPRDGVVARILARDGVAVGYGHPLVELR